MSELDNLQQLELVKMQTRLIETGQKTVILVEGRDAAGKDGFIRVLSQNLNPRATNIVALPVPTPHERTQWYFQRYVRHLPAGGEMTIFNRSWYNRAGVEPVMGFCTPEQHRQFLRDVRRFEHLLVDDGIRLIKIWFDISREEQARRIEARMNDPIKFFKLSPVDLQAQALWDNYSVVIEEMMALTNTKFAPWSIITTDKKKEARRLAIQLILDKIEGLTDDKGQGLRPVRHAEP